MGDALPVSAEADDELRLLQQHQAHERALGLSGEDQEADEKREKPYPAYFFPQLSQQRSVFCLDVLKREDIRSVCELGCGEGSVLRPMCNGASHSDSFPEPYFEDPVLYDEAVDDEDNEEEEETSSAVGQATTSDTSPAHKSINTPSDTSPAAKSINTQVLNTYRSLPASRSHDKELHLRRIAGLDLHEYLLADAAEATAPPPEEPSPFASYYSFSDTWERWEDLRIELWQGSLDVFNDAFDNFEAFIMTEVIEHLYERTLSKFPDILFGSYRPRIVVITTPNYEFNQFFDLGKRSGAFGRQNGEEKAEDETKNSFKDPTGRTDRRFRDDDHKFEWTQAEFKNWCDTITSQYDYTVEIAGVGSLRNYFGKGGFHAVTDDTITPPSGRAFPPLPEYVQEALDSVPDPSKFYATQTAVFRRKYAYESERQPRSLVQAPLAFYGVGPKKQQAAEQLKAEAANHGSTGGSSTGTSPNQHKLVKSHYYKAAAVAGNSKSLRKIRRALDELMRERMRLRACSLRELWGRSEIASACGGYLNKIIEAVIQDSAHKWELEYRPSVLDRGGQMDDAVFLVLKDFIEPETDWGDDEEEEEELTKGAQSMWVGGDDPSDEESSRKDDDPDKPRKTKKQKQKERLETQQAEEEERKAQDALFPKAPDVVWEPEAGDDTWADWERSTNKGLKLSEEEWDRDQKAAETSGWD